MSEREHIALEKSFLLSSKYIYINISSGNYYDYDDDDDDDYYYSRSLSLKMRTLYINALNRKKFKIFHPSH